jgi:hypothetical protein
MLLYAKAEDDFFKQNIRIIGLENLELVLSEKR